MQFPLLLGIPLVLFGIGFVVGGLMNHPEEMSPPRMNPVVAFGWIAWTALCAVLLYVATGRVLSARGVRRVALGHSLDGPWPSVVAGRGLDHSRNLRRAKPPEEPLKHGF